MLEGGNGQYNGPEQWDRPAQARRRPAVDAIEIGGLVVGGNGRVLVQIHAFGRRPWHVRNRRERRIDRRPAQDRQALRDGVLRTRHLFAPRHSHICRRTPRVLDSSRTPILEYGFTSLS